MRKMTKQQKIDQLLAAIDVAKEAFYAIHISSDEKLIRDCAGEAYNELSKADGTYPNVSHAESECSLEWVLDEVFGTPLRRARRSTSRRTRGG